MNRWLVWIPLVILAALIGVLALKLGDVVANRMAESASSQQYKPDAMVGQPIPETVMPMLTGDTAGPGNLDLKTAGVGRPMLVNVFASWCAPCRLEHPKLLALKARGIAVVGVAYKDEPVATRAFLDELGDPYSMVLVDHEGRAGLDLGISGVPETFAVDAMGRITAKQSGPLLNDADIERLVASMQAPPRPAPGEKSH
ncbi:MAG: DsbE family thiol:disulfide interchange protein [Alphaproteobacteria bacterium]|jgi:cytochrome c biogenesis protein CcmG/thiol:disulfide interchange protein DsbE|uniref:Thiol:disulfide interchange protein DsbE n=1 Tax=Brevundimonas mediterranea TaxID=74329 RepID=A0A7Z9C576_9CAUL|nr:MULTISPECIES: DsbE family thiol:disulfide interchange protein [Brevundimonas]MBU4198146.1 DsbE family thiol:disulfide interchange protein [Alphaproteobacteria bacterium]MBU4237917.1 DsbE family thiol:disulfide interchange protein [Alphaproteobacteria bacterium]MCG2662071.1 DsbE family thiol:disulfide interchange protein [Brevundimonas sp.]VDC49652.1 Thiol:disulfide interchange protein DsbE [Brevundimonas mediterranea]